MRTHTAVVLAIALTPGPMPKWSTKPSIRTPRTKASPSRWRNRWAVDEAMRQHRARPATSSSAIRSAPSGGDGRSSRESSRLRKDAAPLRATWLEMSEQSSRSVLERWIPAPAVTAGHEAAPALEAMSSPVRTAAMPHTYSGSGSRKCWPTKSPQAYGRSGPRRSRKLRAPGDPCAKSSRQRASTMAQSPSIRMVVWIAGKSRESIPTFASVPSSPWWHHLHP